MSYSKVLSSKPMLYFQCVPPYTLADEASAAQREKLSFIGAELHEGSVYYYWWAFLRWNGDYRECCENGGAGPMAALYADFGDVRDSSFWNWWIKGGRLLFCEPPDEPILRPPHIPPETDDSNRVTLNIPVTGDIDRTMAELRKLLKPAFDKERRRRKDAGESWQGQSRARYQVLRTPYPEALYQCLKVWEAKQKEPALSNFVIGINAGLAKESKSPDLINVVGATVGRYLREAEALIYNAGHGRFPDKTRPPNLPMNSYRRRPPVENG
jgi:hypothetical protein